MTWDEAIAVLRGWEGEDVLVVPFLDPGISLEPIAAPLALDEPRKGLVRLQVGIAIALPKATFIEAGWIPGQEQHGLSIVQGATRVDVFRGG